MKRKPTPLAEVELFSNPCVRTAHPPGAAAGAPFIIQLPEGAVVSVPPGFNFEETLALLTLVREALR
jgi:hypothetical protein